MASQQQVKRYLAYWLQLGKGVAIQSGRSRLRPRSVIVGGQYSEEFEACWQKVCSPETGDCYLEGTEERIQDLLSANWEVISCARCDMPVPTPVMAMPPTNCPCFDLPSWPDPCTIAPRSPIHPQDALARIRDRLQSFAASPQEAQMLKRDSADASATRLGTS
jgi:hypothetical protein